MDPVTHTLFGAAIGEAFFRKRFGGRAVFVSAVAASLPDIDGIVMLTGDPGSIILRRSFGHSLFLLPVWIAGLAWLFNKKFADMEFRDLALIVAVNCAGHLFFDLLNSFGVQLFWPFSVARPELSIVYIVDFALTAFLAAPLVLWAKASWRHEIPSASGAALAAVAIYLAMAFSARQYALLLLAHETGGRGFQYAFPEPFGAHRWRGVVKERNAWKVYLVDAGRKSVEPRLTVPSDEWSPPARAALETPFGRRVETFFKAPVWTAEAKPGGGWLVKVRDLRFASLLFPHWSPFLFEFDVAPRSASAQARGVRIW